MRAACQHTVSLEHPGWIQYDGAWANCSLYFRGTVYRGTERLEPLAVAKQLATSSTTLDTWASKLAELNGFFAAIAVVGDHVVAAVDHVRSIPLFYAEFEGNLIIGDSAEWIRSTVGETVVDSVAEAEFQLTGYVTGPDTLYPKVKQLQAGECFFGTGSDAGVRIESRRYFQFVHHCSENTAEHPSLAALDGAITKSIERLIAYADGRQIVLPLSGGYDSRVIAIALKRLNYPNVLTFTYGTPEDKECKYSQAVADTLSLRWHRLVYTNDIWKEAWNTPSRMAYQRWASGWCSLAHVQDWLAVKQLREAGIVDDDCVFAPGHTGDFISGGHIPRDAFSGRPCSDNDVHMAILRKHYALAPLAAVSSHPQSFWKQRIASRTAVRGVSDGEGLANAFENWEWQERQGKYICNAVRVYEFFRYDWWLPLWDMEFVRLWQAVPLELRRDRGWYRAYCKQQYGAYNPPAALGNASENRYLSWMKALPSTRFPWAKRFFRKIYVDRRNASRTRNHWLTAGYPQSATRRLAALGFQVNGVAAMAFLNEAGNITLTPRPQRVSLSADDP